MCLRPLWWFVLLAASSPAATVLLRNGDRISGDVVKLDQGKLSLKTAYAGTLEIDWLELESIEANRNFEIEFESGMRVKGMFQRSGGGLVLRTAAQSLAVALPQIVGIHPAREGESRGFLRRLEGTADLGYSLTGGNSSLNQESFDMAAQYRAARYRVESTVSSLFSRQSDAPTNSRHAAALRYDFYVHPRSFLFTMAGLERDERQRLSLRSNVGGGFGWKMIRSRETELALLGGLTFVNEQFAQASTPEAARPRNSSGEALAQLDLETSAWGPAKLTTRLTLHPNIRARGRYRAGFDTTIRFPLVGPINWTIRLFDRFDSRPPLAAKRNDYGLISGLGLAF
jgi:hypothetical protein